MARGFKAASVIGAGIIAVGLSAGSAHAVFINGSVGLTDAGITLSNLPGSMVSALTSITLGPTAVPGPCTVNFVGCNAPAPGTTLTLPLVSGAMTGVFSTPVGGTPFMWTFGTIVGTVARTAPVNIGGLITDSIQFVATGTVDDGPGGFDPTFAIINFNASANCIWHRHDLQCGYSHRHLAGDVECRGHAHPGSRTRYACPSRPRPGRTRIQPAQEGLSFNTSVEDDPAAAGFVISGPWCWFSSPRNSERKLRNTWAGADGPARLNAPSPFLMEYNPRTARRHRRFGRAIASWPTPAR